MNKIALRSAAALVSGSMVLSGSCRRKEEPNRSITTEQTAGKSRPQVDSSDKAPVSDFQKNRIRNSVESASKEANHTNNEKSTLEFVALLQSYPSDTVFLHELALETSSTSDDTQNALASALARMYQAGEYSQLGEALEALKTTGTMGGMLIHRFASALGDDHKDLVVGAYENLLSNPFPKKGVAGHCEFIAQEAAQQIGYLEALRRIPDVNDRAFGTAAASAITAQWTRVDPVAASTYLRDLPDSEVRSSLLVHMVEQVAENNDFEMARSWANYLKGESRDRALHQVDVVEANLRDREQQDAERKARSDAGK